MSPSSMSKSIPHRFINKLSAIFIIKKNLVGGGVGSGLAGGGVGRSTSSDSSPRKLLIGSLEKKLFKQKNTKGKALTA